MRTSNEPVQWFRDLKDRVWHVYVVVEGTKFGAVHDRHRHDWLCLESDGERRFITPVPDGWQRWSDMEFRTALNSARLDLRGP
jgi:hypothetical protein